jgi:hypothetical protein
METPTPLPTQTPAPTGTPVGMVVYTVVAPGSETGQEVVFRYEMDAGQVLISALLFGIFLVIILKMLLDIYLKDQK